MGDHYYTAHPSTEHAESSFTADLRGMSLRFYTDSAVFSRTRIDTGTLLLVNTMEILPDDVVLDMGCGYGPVGVVSAHMAFRGYVYMVDVNERAVQLAKRNLAENGITNAEVLSGDRFAPVHGLAFDKILMNPPIRAGKTIVYDMIHGARAALRSGGSLWIVIQTKQGAPSMKRKLHELFGNVSDVARESGYHILVSWQR